MNQQQQHVQQYRALPMDNLIEKREKNRAKKGRQAIWGDPTEETNKYFKKKSSHKNLLQNDINYKKSAQTKKFLRKRIKQELLFENLPEGMIVKMVKKMYRVDIPPNMDVVCCGDAADAYFVIEKGKLEIWKQYSGDDEIKKDELVLKDTLNSGDTFGDNALLYATTHQYTYRASAAGEGCRCWALSQETFDNIRKKQESSRLESSSKQISDDCKSFENRVKCKLSEFKEIGVLGVGTFARVTLVEDPFENKVYALKKVRKNRIVETSQQEHIINEKRIMAALDTHFCIRLFATFKDALNVYFLLEPVTGGELFSLLKHQKRLKPRHAMFYCACVVLAFEYMHTKLNVIYRHLKPENLLISKNGYLKLVDFGFAKKRNNTCTLCGTPRYLAPEVIQNFAHGFAMDWWSVGILIYEMLFGFPPFEDDKNMKMYEKILVAPVEFPSEPLIKPSAKDIINSLLRKQAHKRLGADQIKKHHFFKRMDWAKMSKQELDPPWKPRIKGNYDLSAFDRFPDTTPDNEQLIHDPDGYLFKWCDEF